MIKQLAHVCISAKDLDASAHFYTEVLGLRRAFNFRKAEGVFGFYLEVGPGNYIEVFQRAQVDAPGHGPIQHICLEVEDIDAVARQLAQHDCEVTEKTLGADQSWQIWTTDPAGVRIEFHQYTDTSSQRTGRDCVLE